MNGTEQTNPISLPSERPGVLMWVFLFTELLLFGILFTDFAKEKYYHYAGFSAAAEELNLILAALSTFILLTASLTTALAYNAVREKRNDIAFFLLAVSVLLTLFFAVNRIVEYGQLTDMGLVSGTEEMVKRSEGENIFFNLYYWLNIAHFLHAAAGIVILSIAAWLIRRSAEKTNAARLLMNTGLYVHTVTIIWLFIFPLCYIIG